METKSRQQGGQVRRYKDTDELSEATADRPDNLGGPHPEPTGLDANAQALPTCPRCQRTFRARTGLVGPLRTQCNTNPTTLTSTSSSPHPPSDPPHILAPGTNSTTPTIIETTYQYSPPGTPHHHQ
ncbi:unnamed protein product [Schistocephalus solidus]|uniref:Uncharacterized protein n=1 Tax=Schistocephalus solidus TaxID=70667 RepID=A0A183SMU7_SCHSO|nr:unnamed protein product [Schistocephalus solidus]